MKKGKKTQKSTIFIVCISIVLVVCTAFLTEMRDSGIEYRGLPFNWLALHSNNGFSFLGVGFILDVLIFILAFKLLIKMYRWLVAIK